MENTLSNCNEYNHIFFHESNRSLMFRMLFCEKKKYKSRNKINRQNGKR